MKKKSLTIAHSNLQCGVNATKGWWHYALLSWRYFFPHSLRAAHRTKRFINDELLDVISFSEIEGISFRSGGIDHMQYLAKRTGLKYVRFFATHRVRGIINQGNAIMSKYPIKRLQEHRLPGAGQSRFLGSCELDVNGTAVAYFVTHLGLSKKDRVLQIKKISKIIAQTKNEHIILAGDFNTIDHDELVPITKQLQDIPFAENYPSWNPTRTLDYIFVSKALTVEDQAVLTSARFSDHLPLRAKIKID